MGACAGAFAAAATTPLDVIKTNMMCTAASRPTMMSASRAVLAQGGPKYFFRYCSGLCGNNYFASMNSVQCIAKSGQMRALLWEAHCWALAIHLCGHCYAAAQ